MPYPLSADPISVSRWIGYCQFLNHCGSERRALTEQFPSPDHVLNAPASVPLASWRSEIMRGSKRDYSCPPDSWVMTMTDDLYSPLLGECDDAPSVLFGRGDYSQLNKPAIAIVGSRRPSLDGRLLAQRFAYELASAGFVIVSGLATGIDAAAHRGALEAAGHTVAVVATGIDTTYPAVNRTLSETIVENGALLSQFVPGSAPKRHHFPRRNRTISGLSLATLVIEAGLPSGTLITATAAAEQGRDVFVLPWSVRHQAGRGCLKLLMEGALLATTPEDVIRGVNWHRPLAIGHASSTHVSVSGGDGTLPRTTSQTALLEALGDGSHSSDDIARLLSLDIAEVHRDLVKLEIDGQVMRHDSGCWIRA